MKEVASAALPAHTTSPTPSGNRGWALIQALRPKQWAKNILVAAAPLAAGELSASGIANRVVLMFVALCCASSAGYLINDVRDRDYDRAHPRKCMRPIASGQVSTIAAVSWAAGLVGVSIVTASICGRSVALLTVLYLVVTLAYSLWLKTVPGLEMVMVSAGFLLRAVIGGVGTSTMLSGWFLIVICAAALLVVAGKRVAEMQRLQSVPLDSAAAPRTVLTAYSARYLNLISMMAATIAVAAYSGWVIFVGMHRGSGVLTAASAAPVAAGIARYVHVINSGGGERPEDALLDDWMMIGLGALWLALFSTYVASAN